MTNYLGHVKTACLMVKLPVGVFDDPALVRAKRSVTREFQRRTTDLQWIRRSKVEQMIKWAKSRRSFDTYVMLFLFAYCFLLR